jgi:hypothetical protein
VGNFFDPTSFITTNSGSKKADTEFVSTFSYFGYLGCPASRKMSGSMPFTSILFHCVLLFSVLSAVELCTLLADPV